MGIFKWMMRTGKSAPGGTARTMTENYYNGEHSVENAYNLKTIET